MATIIVSESGTVYIKQRYRDEDGKVRQKKIRCKNKKEAKIIIDEVENCERQGLLYEEQLPEEYISPAVYKDQKPISSKMTVAELIPMYLDYALRNGDIRPNTYEAKMGILRNHINPYIGDVHITRITTGFIQAYLRDIPNLPAAKGNHKTDPGNNSYRQAEEVKKVLSKSFGYAISELGILHSNPVTSDIKLKKKPEVQLPQLTHEEFIKLMESDTDDLQLKLILALMFSGPLRISETLGLTWDLVHIPNEISDKSPAYIEIKQELLTIKRDSLEKSETKPILIFPSVKKKTQSVTCLVPWTKNARSTRLAYLPKSVAELILQYKQRQDDMRIYYGKKYKDYNLVFAQEDRYPGRPVNKKSLTNRYHDLCEKIDLPKVRVYSTRGTGTSELLRKSKDITAVSAAMGGDSPEVILKYYASASVKDRLNLVNILEEDTFSQINFDTQNDQNDTKQTEE